jgi:hypothetical protein
VDVLERAEYLVHEVSEMLVRQGLVAADNLVQVSVHQLRDLVHVRKFRPRSRGLNVNESDNVLVVQEPQQLDLSKCSLRIGLVIEGIADLFDRHFAARGRVPARAALCGE